MEFTNLTPFSTLNYLGYDTHDQEYEVVTMCAEYNLIPSNDKVAGSKDFKEIQTVYIAEVNDENPISLCMADEFYDVPNTSSILQESDIIPFKPKCDVLVQGHAYASKPCQGFKASIALYRQDDEKLGSPLTEILSKEIWLTGSRQWQHTGSRTHIDFSQFTSDYTLTAVTPTQKVPLRYEYALGGSHQVAPDKSIDKNKDGDKPEQYHEVCYRNPIGRGWFENSYFNKLKEYKQDLPEFYPAPQIMPKGVIYETPLITKQQGAMTAFEMAKLDYQGAPAGLGALHRSWAPRLAKAGTYDEAWLENRHPNLPKDFDFNYWNCAPEDQQIDYPDLTKPHTLLVSNLMKGGGQQSILLPRHRAFVLASIDYEHQVMPMSLDTLIFNTDKMTLKLVWRLFLPTALNPTNLEARFITDPKAPYITYEDPESIRARALAIWNENYVK